MSNYMIVALVLVAVTSVHCASRSTRELVLDGRGVSPAQQCKNKDYSGLCKASDAAERCSQLKCTHTGRGDIPVYEIYNVGPALQGTPCGENKICIAGKCLEDPNPPQVPAVFNDEEYDCIDYDDYEVDEE